MRKLNLLLFLTGVLFGPPVNHFKAQAQRIALPERIDRNSPNGCYVYQAPEPWRWTKMASDPVDTPLVDFSALTLFLAPSNAEDVLQNGAIPIFDKAWQIAARKCWEWTDEDFNHMWFSAQQGEGSNWVVQDVNPCSLLADMMHGRAPSTTCVGKPTLVDFTDNGPREAWVFPLKDGVEAVFFKDCSNPSWRAVKPISAPTQALPPDEPKPMLTEWPNKPLEIDWSGFPKIPAPQLTCPNPEVNVDCQADHPVNVDLPPMQVNVAPAPVTVMPADKQVIEIQHKVPWHQAGFNITGMVFHGTATAWLIKNWNFKVPGPQGDTGATGPEGQQGIQGIPGQNGDAGPTGQTGPQGPLGPTGPGGPQGTPGQNGRDGVSGGPGPTGPTGPIGPTGRTGNTGPRGPAGPAGRTGNTGPGGPAGAPGGAGPQGPIGPIGPQGPIGPIGPQGPAGPVGGCVLPDGKPCGMPPIRP